MCGSERPCCFRLEQEHILLPEKEAFTCAFVHGKLEIVTPAGMVWWSMTSGASSCQLNSLCFVSPACVKFQKASVQNTMPMGSTEQSQKKMVDVSRQQWCHPSCSDPRSQKKYITASRLAPFLWPSKKQVENIIRSLHPGTSHQKKKK